MSSARRLARRFAPWRWHLAGAAVLVVVGSALQGLPIFFIRYALDGVLIAKNPEGLVWLAPAVVALYLLNGVVTVGRAMLTRSVAWRLVTELRDEMYAHVLGLDVTWHQSSGSGERVNRLMSDVNALQYSVSGVVTAVQKPITLVVLAGTAFVMNPRLAFLALVALPLVAWPVGRFGTWVRHATGEAMAASAKLSSLAQESMAGIRVVQLSGGEGELRARFGRLNQEHERFQLRALTAQLLPAPVTEILASIGVGLVLWVGGAEVVAGRMAAGDLVAFLVALAVMNQPLKGLSEVNALFQRSLAAADRVYAVLDQPSAVQSGTGAVGALVRITFSDVAVDYGGGPVLQGVHFHLEAGRRVALVGESGSGKTSLLNLIPRLYDPSAGAVCWNGVDVRSLSLADLRANVSVVTQETFLFDDTVANNIQFGRPEATRLEVEAAAHAAHADAFIRALPQGYDTRVDELGMRLSGGQRQRICIARAILRAAPVLLLDEATSNLDSESEAAVQAALDALLHGRTTLVVAHRLSTVRDADWIVVLAGGRVVEQGVHADLSAAGGEYARLLSRQA